MQIWNAQTTTKILLARHTTDCTLEKVIGQNCLNQTWSKTDREDIHYIRGRAARRLPVCVCYMCRCRTPRARRAGAWSSRPSVSLFNSRETLVRDTAVAPLLSRKIRTQSAQAYAPAGSDDRTTCTFTSCPQFLFLVHPRRKPVTTPWHSVDLITCARETERRAGRFPSDNRWPEQTDD